MAIRKVSHISEADHGLVTKAVAEAERHTSGEIVTIVTELSDHYNDIALAWATAVSFFALGVVALCPAWFLDKLDWLRGGWEHEYSAGEYVALLIVLAVLKWLAVWLLMLSPPLRMALTPRAIRQGRVRARAISLFKVGTESKTAGHTGILLYLSMKEHRAEIVADRAIAEKVDPAVWGDAMVALLDHVKADRAGEGMAEAVRQMGLVLAEHFPRGSENPNELLDRLIEL